MMIQVFLTHAAFFNIILILKYADAVNEDPQKMTLFQRFKQNYNRVYPDKKSEQKGYDNFVNNLAEVNNLNKKHPSNVVVYQLNRFADLDPAEIKERYGLSIKPYEDMAHGNKEAMKREHRHKFLEDMHLYDLNEVEDLYINWTKKWEKPALTKKLDKSISYFRFIKSVVETNQKKYAGEDVSLDKDANVVRQPNQYFYGK